jgi:hypothetical protein
VGRLDPAGQLDQRRQLGVAAAQLAGTAGVGVDGRVGQLLLQLGMLAQQVLERLAHNNSKTENRGTGNFSWRTRQRRRWQGPKSLLPAPRTS